MKDVVRNTPIPPDKERHQNPEYSLQNPPPRGTLEYAKFWQEINISTPKSLDAIDAMDISPEEKERSTAALIRIQELAQDELFGKA